MPDDTKLTDDKPVKEDKPVEEPVVEPVVDEPKADAPADAPAPDASGGAPAGTDPAGRELYDITCSSCGKKAQVPFKPSGDRPVYCKDCYMKQRNG